MVSVTPLLTIFNEKGSQLEISNQFKPRFDLGKQKMKMIVSSLQREDIINKVIPTINNKAKLKIQDFAA